MFSNDSEVVWLNDAMSSTRTQNVQSRDKLYINSLQDNLTELQHVRQWTRHGMTKDKTGRDMQDERHWT